MQKCIKTTTCLFKKSRIADIAGGGCIHLSKVVGGKSPACQTHCFKFPDTANLVEVLHIPSGHLPYTDRATNIVHHAVFDEP